jgi:glycosyltransferase involved in cell wall biosynthesis
VRLSVVIPTKDRPELLADTLATVGASEPPPGEVIVVDASAGDGSRAVVEAAAARWPHSEFRHLTGSRGACRQRNRALEEARGELVAFLDDDVRLRPETLARLLAPFADPAVVGATGKVLERSPRRISLKHSPLRRWLPGAGRQGTLTRAGYPNRLWALDDPHDVEVMAGCLMAARADHARAVGFDERLEAEGGYALLDDEDFAYRLSRRGRLLYTPAAVAEHRNTGFSAARSREFNHSLVRNRHYTFHKSFSPSPGARAQWWALMAIHVAHRAVNRDWPGVRGLLDGLREVVAGRSR